MDWNSPENFARWFYDAFIDPLLQVLKEHDVLGYSLWEWLIVMCVSSLAVKVFQRLFAIDTPTQWKE